MPQGSWFVPRLCLLWVAAYTGLSATARADSDLPGPIPAALVRVIDGDSIDAPELNGACPEERRRAEEARAILADLLGAGPVWLAEIQRDKYGGRVVADVVTRKGRNASAAMLAVRAAVEWGARAAWCLH